MPDKNKKYESDAAKSMMLNQVNHFDITELYEKLYGFNQAHSCSQCLPRYLDIWILLTAKEQNRFHS